MLAPYQTTLGHCICDEPLCNLAIRPKYHFIAAWALLAQTIATKLQNTRGLAEFSLGNVLRLAPITHTLQKELVT